MVEEALERHRWTGRKLDLEWIDESLEFSSKEKKLNSWTCVGIPGLGGEIISKGVPSYKEDVSLELMSPHIWEPTWAKNWREGIRRRERKKKGERSRKKRVPMVTSDHLLSALPEPIYNSGLFQTGKSPLFLFDHLQTIVLYNTMVGVHIGLDLLLKT